MMTDLSSRGLFLVSIVVAAVVATYLPSVTVASSVLIAVVSALWIYVGVLWVKIRRFPGYLWGASTVIGAVIATFGIMPQASGYLSLEFTGALLLTVVATILLYRGLGEDIPKSS
jgi:hypothetical protein